MRRVVVTGLGLIAPTGVGAHRFWQALLEGPSGIGPLTRFTGTGFPCQVAGQVPDDCCDNLVDPRTIRTTSHATRLALAAAELALRDARLPAGSYEPAACGTVIGSALGGWTEAQQQHAVLLERGARRVNPFAVSGAGAFGPAIEVAAAVGAQGHHLTISSGCPSALQAIAHAAFLVASGGLDICLAGGTESPLNPLTFAALSRTQELSTHAGADASRPFDRGHAGMVLSEGSCIVVLESEEGAAARRVTPYAEIVGGTSSCDAQGMYGIDCKGDAAARAIEHLLRQHEVTPGDLNYICAHANSSPAFDRKEALVLRRALGEFAAAVPISSIKGIIGHPFGASGAFQLAATALAFRHQLIPPTHHLEDPDPECELAHVTGSPRSSALRWALITSYGYGGVNAYLLARAPDTHDGRSGPGECPAPC